MIYLILMRLDLLKCYAHFYLDKNLNVNLRPDGESDGFGLIIKKYALGLIACSFIIRILILFGNNDTVAQTGSFSLLSFRIHHDLQRILSVMSV